MKAMCYGLISLVLMVTVSAQNPQSAPGAESTRQASQQPVTGTTKLDKRNAEQLQRDADELQALTRSIPADIDAANRGLLPKDMVEKLKRIEKLSKQLRKELSR
jgi:hypothetical protein